MAKIHKSKINIKTRNKKAIVKKHKKVISKKIGRSKALKRTKVKKKDSKSSIFTFFRGLFIFLILVAIAYVTFIFVPFKPIRDLRNLYIETAMTTSHHQYLAKWFIPGFIIDEVMDDRNTITDKITDTNLIMIPSEPEYTLATPSLMDVPYDANDLLNQKIRNVGDFDELGNKIFINDLENGILVIDIDKSGFKGKLALISNPKQVYLGYAKDNHYKGNSIQEFLTIENAVLGTNASGFLDPGGVGLGCDSSGLSYSEGVSKSTYKDVYNSFGFDKDDKFVIGHFEDWESMNMRDGMQFNPAMIINGVIQDNAKARMGLHPRTCIGQRADGVVALLVIDGRTAETGLGGSIKQAAEIMLTYGCINAANCDGGASTIMAYKGDIINDCSYKYAKGRWLPNAWLVKSREVLGIPAIKRFDEFNKSYVLMK